MLHIALYQPEIPPNTGNIIRLCANTGVCLHLIHPLGFNVTDRHLKRAGLDYHDWAQVQHHQDWDAFLLTLQPQQRLWLLSTKGQTPYHQVQYQNHDVFVFGPETRGLPTEILNRNYSHPCAPPVSG